MEIKKLKKGLSEIKDPRRTRYGNYRHKLEDIIIIGLCTLVCGGEDFVDMEDFGKEREQWLRNFLELTNGIPDSDTFRRIFERIEPLELSNCLINWLECERTGQNVIAIDGKTIRGSGNQNHKAYHVVSAFVAENQITLGQITVSEKSNEITAVPELLDMLDVKNSIVTADAMSCQKKITKKIYDKEADYVIGLKANQETFYDDVALYFQEFQSEMVKEKTFEKGHGRIEKREYSLLTDIGWLNLSDEWVNLKAVGMVKSTIIRNDEKHTYTRYFITSLTNLGDFAYAVRKHWSIENQLHWCLDVIFREDDCRARKDNSPLNLNIIRKLALPLLNSVKCGRIGNRKKMFKAALNPTFLAQIIFGEK